MVCDHEWDLLAAVPHSRGKCVLSPETRGTVYLLLEERGLASPVKEMAFQLGSPLSEVVVR